MGSEGDSLNWTARQQQPFEELKLAITSAPALGLPDPKPFTLYVTEKDKVAMGVLSQTMGPWDKPATVSLISWTMLPLGGWDAYGQLLQLPYSSRRQPS